MTHRFQLPSGEKSIEARFIKLCELQPDSALPNIREHITSALGNLRSQNKAFLGPNLKLAEAIAYGCNQLLDAYPKLTEEHKQLAIGAIRYFLVHMDTLPDSKPLVGLDDDALVLNHVIEQAGLKIGFVG